MPTEISHARARGGASAFDPDDLRAPSRAGGARARRSSRKNATSPMSSMIARLPRPRLSSGTVIACAAFCALMTGVVVNALYLQTEKHQAPLFSGPPASFGARVSAPPVQREAETLAHTPAPLARPAVEPTAAPMPRPAQRETAGSLGRPLDSIGGLLAGATAATRAAPPRATAATHSAAKPAAIAKPVGAIKPAGAIKPVAHAPAKTQATAKFQPPLKAQATMKPQAAPKAHAAAKPQAPTKSAIAGAPRAKANSTATTERISDDMRKKLASISAIPAKPGATPKPARNVAAQDDE